MYVLYEIQKYFGPELKVVETMSENINMLIIQIYAQDLPLPQTPTEKSAFLE